MNSIEKIELLGPEGKTEECAKFIINDATIPFKFKGVCMTGIEYTMGLWIKSTESGRIYIGEDEFETGSEWTRCESTFTAFSDDAIIVFSVGEYFVYHAKLERGNKATDWTPAPEDGEAAIEGAYASIELTKESIISIVQSVERVDGELQEAKTQITQTNEAITTEITKVNDRVDGEVETLNTTITNSIDGVKSEVTEEYTDAIDKEVKALNTTIEQTQESIMIEVNKKTDEEDVQSLIDAESDNILLKVSETYVTGEAAQSMINQSAGEIKTEVSKEIDDDVKDALTTIRSEITQTAESIELKVDSTVGANLLKNSNEAFGNKNYPTAIYTMLEVPDAGETVTVTIYGAHMEGGTDRTWGVFHGDGNTHLGNLSWVSTGRYAGTFAFKTPVTESGVLGQIRIYAMPANSEQMVYISKAKLERGSRSTDWSPALGEFIAGSTVTINEEAVSISTPKFEVNTNGAEFNIPGVDEENVIRIDADGLHSLKYEGPIVQTLEGGIYTVDSNGADFANLDAAFGNLNNKYITGDVYLKLLGTSSGRVKLEGVTGPGIVHIAPLNLINAKEDSAWTYNGTKRTMLNSVQSSKGFSLTATSAETYRAATLSLGHAGSMGLKPGAEVSFRVNIQIAEGSTAYPHAYIYIGGVFHGGVTGASGTDTTEKVLSTTFVVKENVEPTDEVTILFRVCGGTACSANAAVYFRNPVMEIGSSITSGTATEINSYQIEQVVIDGCSAQVCLHGVVIPDGISARQSAVSANRCTFAGENGLTVWGGSGAMYNCYGSCTGFAARASGGGVIEIYGTAPGGTKAGLLDTTNMSEVEPEGDTPVENIPVSYKATLTGTYGISDKAVRQGYTTANGSMKGLIYFDGYTPSTNITKATLRIKRVEGYGKGGDITVTIYGTTASNLNSSPGTAGTAVTKNIAPGETKTIDVTELAKTYKAFVLYAPDTSVISGKTYSTNYARFTGTGGGDSTIPMLTITQ